KTTNPGPDSRELQAVENVRAVLDELDTYERESPPVSLRFGLYSGETLNAQDSILRHIYFEAVDENFLKPAVQRVETDLKSFASAKEISATTKDEDVLGRNYDCLK